MTTALIVIDVQDSFRCQDSWDAISAPDIVERTNRLVDHARVHGETVVWVLHEAPGSDGPFDPVRGLVVLQPGLHVDEADVQIHKTSHNAFTTTNLGQHLLTAGVTKLRVCGIRTEQCVETTTRLASDLGYEVELVIDATATHPLAAYDGHGVIPADVVIARTAAALSGRFAHIVTVDDVVSC